MMDEELYQDTMPVLPLSEALGNLVDARGSLHRAREAKREAEAELARSINEATIEGQRFDVTGVSERKSWTLPSGEVVYEEATSYVCSFRRIVHAIVDRDYPHSRTLLEVEDGSATWTICLDNLRTLEISRPEPSYEDEGVPYVDSRIKTQRAILGAAATGLLPLETIEEV